MANWKKPTTWAVITGLLLCISVLVSCAVNPSQEQDPGTQPLAADPTEVSKPSASSSDTSVTIGLSIPFDVTDLEYGAGERRFFPTEIIPGKAGSQIIATELLGGIRIYEKPDTDLQDMDAWLQAVGVPQVVSGGYDYMISSSTSADLQADFIDAGGRETNHYYYIQGNCVFELWFDPSKLDAMTQAAILESVYFSHDALIERTLPSIQDAAYDDLLADTQQSEEQHYLEKCRSALESLQAKNSYTIRSHTNNYGGPILNDTSSYWYYKNGADWLKVVYTPDEGFTRGFGQFGYMCVDGVYYGNEFTYWDENEDIIWGEEKYNPAVLPWIATFGWDNQDVLFVSMTPAGKGQCITLQIMAPYYPNRAYEDMYSFYQTQFLFNEHGALDRIVNTFYFHHDTEGDYSSQETIQEWDDMAENVIAHEYNRYLSGK